MRQLSICLVPLFVLSLAACGMEPAADDTSELVRIEQAKHFRGAAYSWQRLRSSSSTGGCTGAGCFGFLVGDPNHPTTVCADGSHAELCPVVAADLSALDADPRELIALTEQDELAVRIDAAIVPIRRGRAPVVGYLEVYGVWLATEPGEASGALYSIEGDLVGCVSGDCPLHAELLNTSVEVDLEAVDLLALNLDRATLAEADAAAATGHLLVTGVVDGSVLRAEQVLLPVAVAEEERGHEHTH